MVQNRSFRRHLSPSLEVIFVATFPDSLKQKQKQSRTQYSYVPTIFKNQKTLIFTEHVQTPNTLHIVSYGALTLLYELNEFNVTILIL